jgi:hypothetical protein
MILHRHSAEGGLARLAHPGKGELRLRLVLLLTATPIALALAATLLPRGLSHAADSIPVEWIPGDIQNIQDLSGCHTKQDATIKASTPELARQIRDQINLVKEKNLGEHGLKIAYSWKSGVSGDSVALEIQTRYEDGCPGPSSSALQPRTGAEIQPASFQNASFQNASFQNASLRNAGRQSARRQGAGLQRSELLRWVKTAFAAVATGVIYTTVLAVILGVIAAVAPEAAGVAVAALAGCVAGAAAGVIGAALLLGTWQESLTVGLAACAWGGLLGPLVPKGTHLFGALIDEIVTAGTARWMGPGAAAAASEAGVELQPLADVLSTTGEEVLRAAR